MFFEAINFMQSFKIQLQLQYIIHQQSKKFSLVAVRSRRQKLPGLRLNSPMVTVWYNNSIPLKKFKEGGLS